MTLLHQPISITILLYAIFENNLNLHSFTLLNIRTGGAEKDETYDSRVLHRRGQSFLTTGDWRTFRAVMGATSYLPNNKWTITYGLEVAYGEGFAVLPRYDERSTIISADQTDFDTYAISDVQYLENEINRNRLLTAKPGTIFLARLGAYFGRRLPLSKWDKWSAIVSLGIDMNYYRRSEIIESIPAVINQSNDAPEDLQIQIFTPYFHRTMNVGIALIPELQYELRPGQKLFLSGSFRRNIATDMALSYAMGGRASF